ncbi:hypothetical protein E5082_30635 [Streptomyces griseoluteus]|uniref:Uncharacterized protein n=1 Tax=Streptomyces griseoluteus TaxID=29306 RepID=A0A4Z1CYW8_STRGP|nr:hypothetical protein E5082_30635 [Streptomyces griseoluteus]
MTSAWVLEVAIQTAPAADSQWQEHLREQGPAGVVFRRFGRLQKQTLLEAIGNPRRVAHDARKQTESGRIRVAPAPAGMLRPTRSPTPARRTCPRARGDGPTNVPSSAT